MKKIIPLLCIVVSIQAVIGQNNNPDSTKAALANYNNPLERFTATIKYLETIDTHANSQLDSAVCIDLLQIAQQLKNDSLLATSYNWIGYFFYTKKGDNAAALEYYFKALPLAIKFKDKRRISSIYFDIANTYYNLKNYVEYFNFTKKGGENLPDKISPRHGFMLVQFQRNMGTYYLEKNQLDSALYYIQAAMQTCEPIKNRLYKIQTKTLVANIYSKMNENELAEVYFKKAQIENDSITARKEIFYRRYITFLFKNNRMAEAKLQAENFWSIASGTENLNVKLLAAGYKKELFDKLNQIDSAYYYSNKESEIRELIFNQDNQNAIQAMAFKEQLRLMEDAAKKSEEALQRKQNIQYALLALGIITFIITFLLLSRKHITNTKLIQFLGVVALLLVF